MKKLIPLLFLGAVFLFLIYFLFFEKIVFIPGESLFLGQKDFAFLLLGKPGPGYIGSENTDSILVVYYQVKKNKLFLIPIPRDLVVRNEKGELEKINALYPEKKIDLLLKKASDYSGLKIGNYLVIDLELVKKLVDKLGGLEVELDEHVTDAVTLYTLPAGRQRLNGDLVELVLRSRYNPNGDFFRIKNQTKVILALKEKLLNLDNKEKLELVRFFEQNKYYWQTNFDKNELLKLALSLQDIQNLKIMPIFIDTHSGLLTSSYFRIYNTENVYGILPRSGIDNYEAIRIYLRAQMKE